jgi:hypothetical protein
MIRGWRVMALWFVGMMLIGCSWIGLGYNRLPEITRLWLDKQLNLESTHIEPLQQDLNDLLQWHKRHQLPVIAELLHRWQSAVTAESLSADWVCQEASQVRNLLQNVSVQALPGMVRLARRLGPTQYAALQVSQQKSDAEFRKLWLDPPRRGWLQQAQASVTDTATTAATSLLQARQQQQLEKLQPRYDMLYGTLNAAQLADLRHTIVTSSFAPLLALRERERRAQDLLQTLQTIRALPPSSDEAAAKALVQGWLNRLNTSPHADYARASRIWLQESCTQLSRLHQLSTPAQRQHAREVLADYEAKALSFMR